MTTIDLRGEAHMYSFDILREHEGAGTKADGEESGLEFAHALSEGDHDEW